MIGIFWDNLVSNDMEVMHVSYFMQTCTQNMLNSEKSFKSVCPKWEKNEIANIHKLYNAILGRRRTHENA